MQPTVQKNVFYGTLFLTRRYRLIIVLLLLFQTIVLNTRGQMRQVFIDAFDENNHIKKISFYSPAEGYVAFQKWIGFTADSGRTFTRKYITMGNVDYNGYPVNLTFGFGIKGVKAFGKDTIIAYGDYGAVPSILYSTDQGNTFKLIYQSHLNLQRYTGINDMVFPGNANIGYAVEADYILKTTNRGKTWSPVFAVANSFFDYLEAVNDNTVFAFSTQEANKLWKSTDGGSSWQQVTVPAGGFDYVHFISANKGWLNNWDGKTFYTSNGGSSWVLKNNSQIAPFRCDKMKFIDDSTGYAIGDFFTIYKTSDSGKIWEPLTRDNNYSYLGNQHEDLHFRDNNQFWAGGGHGFLEITTNGGGTPVPKAFFRIDTTNVSVTKVVNLINYSKPGYQYRWYKNDTLFSTAYHASYIHDDVYKETDTIKLVAINGAHSDSTIQIQTFIVPPPPPSITSFTPTSAVSGATITITGTSFTGAISVSFGGVAASSFTVVSNTEIKAKVAAGASGDVSVTTPYGTAIKTGFTFLPPPIINSFTPTTGDVGTVITITGNNFTGATSVSFGDITANSFTVVSSTTITAVIASGASGDVTVITPYGTGKLAGFMFNPHPPVITSFSPTQGRANTTVTITGMNFSNNAADNIVYFGVVKAPVIAATGTSLQVTVPMGATYSPVTVTTGKLTGYSVQLFTPTFEGDTALDEGSFAPKTNFAAGANPIFLSIADVDGDGKVDFSASNFDQNTVGVFRNTGGNDVLSFAPRSVHAFGKNARGMAYGDVDGDGMHDLAIPNYFERTVSVAKNTSIPGAISFADRRNFATRDYPWDAMIHDMDGDGKPDLLVAIQGDGSDMTYQFSVLRNTTITDTITFGLKQDIAAGGVPVALYVADIDGDGKPDIISGNAGLNYNASVFRNTSIPGKISFAPGVNLLYNINNAVIGVGDIDGDGKQDIVVGGLGQEMLWVLRNTSMPGNISFSPSNKYPTKISNNICVSDLTGDARPELIFNDGRGRSIAILKNESTPGNIAFAQKVNYPTALYPSTIRVADFDGDGKPDIAVSNVGSDQGLDSVTILRNQVGDTTRVRLCFPTNGVDITSNKAGTSYQWQENKGSGFVNISDGANYGGANTVVLHMSNMALSWNGYQYRCMVDGEPGRIFKLVIEEIVQPSVTITASDTAVCTNGNITFTATPFNGGPAPGYQWLFNGMPTGVNKNTYNVGGGLIPDSGKISVIMTSNATCKASTTATSNTITFRKMPTVRASVRVIASATEICEGTKVTFTAIPVNGGSNPFYEWRKNGQTVTVYNTSTYIDSTLKQGDNISVFMASNGCTENAYVLSDAVYMKVHPVSTPSVQISASSTSICSGQSVTFTATPVNGGPAPSYQWLVNDVNAGTNSAVFTTNVLANGSQVKVVLTRPQSTCGAAASITSNLITVQVNSLPAITITGNTVVTKGQSTTLQATVANAGVGPVYQWQDSTQTHTWLNVSTASTVVYIPAATGDKIRCRLTATSSCAGSTSIVSTPLVFTVNTPTAIDPVPESGGLRLYPNPVTTTLVVDSLKLSDTWKTLEITNLSGSRVITQDISNRTKVTVWLGHLNKGMYIAVLRQRNGRAVYWKFIKM